MKTKSFFLILILGFLGCTPKTIKKTSDLQTIHSDSSAIIQQKIKTDDSLLANIDSKVANLIRKKSNLMDIPDSNFVAMDWSNSVEIVIIKEEGVGQHPKVDVSVPQDYVLVGGGAVVLEQIAPGALLTASFPDNNLLTWHAASKDHDTPFPHTLVGYAIGLKLKGLDRDELKKYIRFFTNTSGMTQYPETNVSVGSGYNLIGGGAQVNWSGEGNLLVKSIPQGNTWYVKGKEHGKPSPASVTAYAIGIKEIIPNFGSLEINQESKSEVVQTGFGIVSLNIDNDWVVTCPGAEATYSKEGRLLCGIEPGFREVTAISKDHEKQDAGSTFAYAIKIRKSKDSGSPTGNSGTPGK